MSRNRIPVAEGTVGRAWLGRVAELAELFSPRYCSVCRAYGRTMAGQGALCSCCCRLLGLATLNLAQVSVPLLDKPVVAAGEYEYELAHCLLAFKNSGRTDLRPHLAAGLARSIAALSLSRLEQGELQAQQGVWLVPLPSSRSSLARRGFEPARYLTEYALAPARALCPELKFSLVDALRPKYRWERHEGWWRAGDRRAQKQLGRVERQQKMQGSLTIRQPVLGWAGRYLDLQGALCLLCDDVVTTGSSLREAARVLEEAGAQVVGAATVARVPRRSPGPEPV